VEKTKKSSRLKTIASILLVFAIGVFAGTKFFGEKTSAPPIPSKNALFRPATQATDTTSYSTDSEEFAGEIFSVKDGDLIMDAVKKAKPGDLIRVFPGTYYETVYIDKDNISFQGIIEEGNWPVLDGKKKLNDAFLYSGNGIQIEGFKIVNYKGNAIMGQAGNNFVIRKNWIVDTGVYGIFPQFGKNGLIEYNTLTGIEDAAIYVGMCDNVDVLHNVVFGNVAGIEIENSRHCLVENNLAYDNTGGILAFITPGLPIKTTYDVIIRNNFVHDNNHINFGAPGSLVSGIPAGTGILIMAADDIIIEDNIIAGNKNIGIVITDFANGGANAAKDPESDPNPDNITILDNFMVNNGFNPINEIKAVMLTQFTGDGPDILAIGGGTGSSIINRDKYTTFGLGDFGIPAITTSADIKSFLLDKPAEPRKVSKAELGELTYFSICAGCHAYNSRLIGVPMNTIQDIYKNNLQGMVDYMNKPKNLREDYPEMPPQAYLSEDAKFAVAEYILTMDK
jgi:parallel beta-helix repeat protein